MRRGTLRRTTLHSSQTATIDVAASKRRLLFCSIDSAVAEKASSFVYCCVSRVALCASGELSSRSLQSLRVLSLGRVGRYFLFSNHSASAGRPAVCAAALIVLCVLSCLCERMVVHRKGGVPTEHSGLRTHWNLSPLEMFFASENCEFTMAVRRRFIMRSSTVVSIRRDGLHIECIRASDWLYPLVSVTDDVDVPRRRLQGL